MKLVLWVLGLLVTTGCAAQGYLPDPPVPACVLAPLGKPPYTVLYDEPLNATGYAPVPAGTVVTLTERNGMRFVCRLVQRAYPFIAKQGNHWYASDLGNGQAIADEYGRPFELKLRIPKVYN